MASSLPAHPLGDRLPYPFRHLRLERSASDYNVGEPHRHDYYEVFYFAKGEGEHDIDFRTWPLRDGALHVVMPGQVHQLRRSPDSHGHILLFSREILPPNERHGDLLSDPALQVALARSPVFDLDERNERSLLDLIARVEGEETTGIDFPTIAAATLQLLFVQLRRLSSLRDADVLSEGSQRDTLVRLMQLVEENFTRKHAPAWYASEIGMTPGHLSAIVRRLLGRPAGELIHERLVLEAKRLLHHTSSSIKEIAFALGFEDPSYFARFFRKHAGMTPQEFRDGMRDPSG